ncbi:MAG: hypothetical protein ACYTCU_04570 [Planctomycetota bacterium]|jgi:hypothetical protein
MTSLPRDDFDRNTASRSFSALGFDGLSALCREASGTYRPDALLGNDPRGPLPIAYSESRALRMGVTGCVVCDSQTCPAADIAELPGDDLAWFTPNLYPITYPFEDGAPLRGVHLVHWSSLRHEGGLIGADAATAAALLRHLAAAEEFLLHHADETYPDSGEGHRGHVGVIKNRGRGVGGSVEHDHQQILLSSAPFPEPAQTHGLPAALRADADEARTVDDIDGLATTLVPSFMRRPLGAFVVPAGEDAGWLHHMRPETLDACAFAIARLTLAVSVAMATTGGEPAWNLVCHTGPGCGPLFEMRAFTQPLGGYEHLGLYLCEERPETTAGRLREALPAR